MKVKDLRLYITITIGLLLLALCFVLLGWRIIGFMTENKCYMCGNTSDLNFDLMDDDGNVLVHKEICEACFMKLTTEKISTDKVLSVVIEGLPELNGEYTLAE